MFQSGANSTIAEEEGVMRCYYYMKKLFIFKWEYNK